MQILSLKQRVLLFDLLVVFCCSLTALPTIADNYDDQAKALLHDLDDKAAPVLPEIAKESADVQRDVFRSVAEEANDCVAYYYSLEFCVKNTNADLPEGHQKAVGSQLLRELKHDEKLMVGLSSATTEAGGLDRKTIKAEITSGIKENAMKIHNDCGNLSLVITSDKTLFCKSLQHAPSERLRYWLEELKREENDKHSGQPKKTD